jgi:hypothetical protein
MFILSVAFFGGCVLLAIGVVVFLHQLLCSPRPQLPPLPFNASEASSKALQLFDADKDGKIAGPELDACPGLMAALKAMKTDPVRGVNSNQIATRINQWKDSRVRRFPLCCSVTHAGQPLANATVKFVPEEFLKDTLLEIAVGITNSTGRATITVPTEHLPESPPPGIPPGMYRVEITKEGENIPARYNTATELGQEISIDNLAPLKGTVKFDLNYD